LIQIKDEAARAPTLPPVPPSAGPAVSNLSEMPAVARAGAVECFHCGAPVPAAAPDPVTIDGAARPMCCAGCAAVAQAIVANGLTDYYRLRTSFPAPGETVPAALRDAARYDDPALQARFVSGDVARREVTLMLEGVRCAACVWLNERHVARLPGVLSFQVNYATARAQLVFDARVVALSRVLQAIEAIGYHATPYQPDAEQAALARERQRRLRELAVAAVFGMQVMMLAEALYAGAFFGIEPEFYAFFSWLSLLLTLPVMVYAAAPFFQGATRDLRARRIGMDVPVALGLGLAFAASAAATVSGRGEIYYDAVVMFVFFLLAARYVDFSARRNALLAIERLTPAVPDVATRLHDGRMETVGIESLRAGERVLVRPGEFVPADGRVVDGVSSVDEALLTGEAAPRACRPGERVVAGSVNGESPLVIAIERVGTDTVLAAIKRLLARAAAERPRAVSLADRAAVWVTAGVVLAAAVAGGYWALVAPERAVPIVIAMLVVTCPCALAIATPLAYTAAARRLARERLLVARPAVLERLPRVTHVLLDKTGTLTHGEPELVSIHAVANRPEDALALAGALAAHSEHPLAQALRRAAGAGAYRAHGVRNAPGEGIGGVIDGRRYALGSATYVAAEFARPAHEAGRGATGASVVQLADARGVVAEFALRDRVRADARAAVGALRARGLTVEMLTGDRVAAAGEVARATGVDRYRAGLLPEDKLAAVRELQARGAVVLMVGDGVNDAAALAAADVAVAMGRGAGLAQTAAGIVTLAPKLGVLARAFDIAGATRRNIYQNIALAIAYNAVALPLAAAGFIAPWLGALGMSASSLVVVLNAQRVGRGARRAEGG